MKIKNWGKFQRFKSRRPPWIRLYRDLLDDDEWFHLSPAMSKILIGLWLLASEHPDKDGSLPPLRKISFRLRTSEEAIRTAIPQLKHWLILDPVHDEKQLALLVGSSGDQEDPIIGPMDCSETETETETETDNSETDSEKEKEKFFLTKEAKKKKSTIFSSQKKSSALVKNNSSLRFEEQGTDQDRIRFEKEFWQIYPRRDGKKIGKQEAFMRYLNLNDQDRTLIAIAVQHLAAHPRSHEGIGVKDPHRWILSGRGFEPWREWIEETMVTQLPKEGIHHGLNDKDYSVGTF